MTAFKFAAALLFGTGALTAGTLFAVADPAAPPCGGGTCAVKTAALSLKAAPAKAPAAACCGGSGACRGTACGAEACDGGVIPASAVAVCSGAREFACGVQTACADGPCGTSLCTAGGCVPATVFGDACEIKTCAATAREKNEGRVRGSIAIGLSQSGLQFAVDCKNTATGAVIGLPGLIAAALEGRCGDEACCETACCESECCEEACCELACCEGACCGEACKSACGTCPAPATLTATCGAPAPATAAATCECPAGCDCPAPCRCESAPVAPAPKTASAESRFLIPAAYAAKSPAAAPSRIPAGTFTRTLNDQSVTVTFAPTGANAGTVSGTCTVPNGGCDLTFSGDCTATADGLIYGAVCTAKTCGAADADPTAKVAVEAFCQALIDQPFSLRCRTTADGCTISAVKFAGVGIVGTPAPGEPAHLLLTMFSGAYDAE